MRTSPSNKPAYWRRTSTGSDIVVAPQGNHFERYPTEENEGLMRTCYSLCIMHLPQTWLLTGVHIVRCLIGMTHVVPLARATTRYNPITRSN